MDDLDFEALAKVLDSVHGTNWAVRACLPAEPDILGVVATDTDHENDLLTGWLPKYATPIAHYLEAFDPATLRVLLDLANAGLWTTKVLDCDVVRTEPYDFGECNTHDRTFPLGGTCDHQGLSLVDYLDRVIVQQRVRAIKAEDALEQCQRHVKALEARLSDSAGRNIDLRLRLRKLEDELAANRSPVIGGEA